MPVWEAETERESSTRQLLLQPQCRYDFDGVTFFSVLSVYHFVLPRAQTALRNGYRVRGNGRAVSTTKIIFIISADGR